MSEQSRIWQGRFGDEYIERNRPDWQTRLQFWKDIATLPISHALEVGCGDGSNLMALRHAGVEAMGIEVNSAATEMARERGLSVINGEASFVLQHFTSGQFDLVYTRAYSSTSPRRTLLN